MYRTALLFALVSLLFSTNTIIAKDSKDKKPANYSEKSLTKSYPLGEVTNVSISAFSEVVLEFGTENTYTIIADSVLHRHIQVSHESNQLSIKTAPIGKTMEKNLKVENVQSVQRIIIRSNQLEKIQLNAVSHFKSNNAYHSDDFSMMANAVSHIDLNIDCKQFNLDVKACSWVKVSGNSDNSTINSNSISKFSIKDLQSAKVKIDANSCSLLDLHAKETMEITANSISSLVYHGDFKVVKEDLKSIGSLKRN